MKKISIIVLLFMLFFPPYSIKAKTEMVTLNFDQVDINLFLKTMSEITGKSFVISGKVRGQISFVSSKEVPVNKVYDIVLAILQVSGFYAVPGKDNIVYVYPAQEALKMAGDIYYGTDFLDIEKDIIITQIIPMIYANAAELLNVVRPLFGNELLLTAYTGTNVLIANGSVEKINLLLSMVQFLDKEIPREQSDIHIYRLENADAESMAQTLNTLAGSIPARKEPGPQPPGQPQALTERFRVVANKATNSIIIICAPQDYESIKKIIQELDTKREQVLVEALIVEITLDDDESVGFDWNALIDVGEGVDAVAAFNSGLMQQSIQTGGLSGLTIGLLNGTIPSVWAILNANRENTDFKILSTPQIVTLDNQEAIITIGEQIPFLTSSRVDEQNNVISTYDYKDIGIVLKLTPQINKNGYITMNINQQVKKLVEGTTVLENPSVYNREITSKITVKNERTIVIGGLIRDDTVVVEKKVPLLGDIPILGLFFRKNSKQRVRTNLLVFITPHVVTTDEAIETMTRQKKEEQESFRDLQRKR